MASSSSDRYQTARDALAAHDDPSIEIIGPDGFPLIGSVERAEWIIAQMRPVIEAEVTVPAPEKLAMQVYMTVHSFPVPLNGDLMRDLIQRGIEAGIQAAWESWEPETAMETES